jgi:uncharacterized protein YndB with AHSA1/START domain
MCALVAASLGLLLPQARAEVVFADAGGMFARHSLSIEASPERLYRAIGKIGNWWSPAHTWSGDARNLSLDLRAGGCYCERWRGGSAQHGQVTLVKRNELVRIAAQLGPMLEMAVSGVLSFEIKAEGSGSALTVGYRISGDTRHGFDQFGGAVDQVIGEQAARLKRYVETGAPQ